jgi:hypothetical protein
LNGLRIAGIIHTHNLQYDKYQGDKSVNPIKIKTAFFIVLQGVWGWWYVWFFI